VSFNIEKIRKGFPFFNEGPASEGLIYFDSAATTQKPLKMLSKYVENTIHYNANVHRGVYSLAQKSTEEFEKTRQLLAQFLNWEETKDIVFTKGVTESANIVARSWGERHIQKDDLIVVSRMDHHSTFVPLQALAKKQGARFEIVELGSDYRIQEEAFKKILKKKPKLISFPHISNALGIENDVFSLAVMAKKSGAMVMIDGAQSLIHRKVDLKKWAPFVDFFMSSAHKFLGPTGMGFLWAKERTWLEMDPHFYGGDMIQEVSDEATTWNDRPWYFEAGTPNIASVIAWGASLEYLLSLNFEETAQYEKELAIYLHACLKKIPGLKVYRHPDEIPSIPIISFRVPGIHPTDLMSYLDQEKICMRVGHHCVQPLMRSLGIQGTLRVSLSFYNSLEEIDLFMRKLQEAINFFQSRQKNKPNTSESVFDESEFKEWLSSVEDPEMDMSLVDLGLIYSISKKEDTHHVLMTLTSTGCPLADKIVSDVKGRLAQHSDVLKAEVKVTFQPKWNPQTMASEEAKEILNIW